jgi:hypothetical protein
VKPAFANIFSENRYVLGVPAAMGEMVGRIVGLKGTPFGDEYPIIEVGTPHGTILYAGRCYVRLDLSEAELEQLRQFEEDAARCKELYAGRLEEHRELSFFGHELQREQFGDGPPKWTGEVADHLIVVEATSRLPDRRWRALGFGHRGDGETPAEALTGLERAVRDLYDRLKGLWGPPQ